MIKDYTAGIQHIGLPTNDMTLTIRFYQTLGFEIIHEKQIDCQVCFLKLGSLVIETYENKQAALKPGAIDHIALDCTDIEACYAEVNKAGLNPTAIESLPFWEKGIKFFKIEGPNRETLEFCQIL